MAKEVEYIFKVLLGHLYFSFGNYLIVSPGPFIIYQMNYFWYLIFSMIYRF